MLQAAMAMPPNSRDRGPNHTFKWQLGWYAKEAPPPAGGPGVRELSVNLRLLKRAGRAKETSPHQPNHTATEESKAAGRMCRHEADEAQHRQARADIRSAHRLII